MSRPGPTRASDRMVGDRLLFARPDNSAVVGSYQYVCRRSIYRKPLRGPRRRCRYAAIDRWPLCGPDV